MMVLGCVVPGFRRFESQRKKRCFSSTTSHFLFVNKSWRLVRQDGYRRQSLTFRTRRRTAVPGSRRVSVTLWLFSEATQRLTRAKHGVLFCHSSFWERSFLLFIATQSLHCLSWAKKRFHFFLSA
jgi:hypothetical protein